MVLFDLVPLILLRSPCRSGAFWKSSLTGTQNLECRKLPTREKFKKMRFVGGVSRRRRFGGCHPFPRGLWGKATGRRPPPPRVAREERGRWSQWNWGRARMGCGSVWGV